MPDIFLERPVVVICQCIPPCLMPFKRDDGSWESMGCMLTQGHEPPCSLDGPGDFTYREEAIAQGMRIVLRETEGNAMFRGKCPRCGREYAMGAVSIAPAVVLDLTGEEKPDAMQMMTARMGKCARCGNEDLLLAGLCGSCGDQLREGAVESDAAALLAGIRLEQR